MPPTLAPDLASRPLKEIVESPRALGALAKHGFTRLGDVALKGVGVLHGIAGVGEATIALIEKAMGPQVPEIEPDAAVEEGPHPIRLDSPFPGYRMCVVPAGRVEQPGGGYALQESIFIEFDRGEGALRKEAYLMRKFARDRKQVAAAMADASHPWRAEAVAWLRGRDAHARGDYRVLGD